MVVFLKLLQVAVFTDRRKSAERRWLLSKQCLLMLILALSKLQTVEGSKDTLWSVTIFLTMLKSLSGSALEYGGTKTLLASFIRTKCWKLTIRACSNILKFYSECIHLICRPSREIDNTTGRYFVQLRGSRNAGSLKTLSSKGNLPSIFLTRFIESTDTGEKFMLN